MRSREIAERMIEAGARFFHMGSWRRLGGIGQDIQFDFNTKETKIGNTRKRNKTGPGLEKGKGQMKINHAHHIAVNTMEIERAVEFYRDIPSGSGRCGGPIWGRTLVYMEISENMYMELFDLRGGTEDGQQTPKTGAACATLLFDVDDVRAWDAFLKRKGVPLRTGTSEMPQIGKRAILVSDPDGVVVELCESL